jgi:hypothetical protein
LCFVKIIRSGTVFEVKKRDRHLKARPLLISAKNGVSFLFYNENSISM